MENERKIKKWPPPVDLVENENWWNEFWKTESSFGDPADSFLKFLHAADIEQNRQNKTAIDIASGNGRYALELARLGYITTAVELSASGIERINQTALQEGLNICTKKLDFISDNFDLGKFDMVVSSGLLEEIPKYTHEVAVERFAECCLPGGKMILRYCIEIQGRGLLVNPGTIDKMVEKLGFNIEYFKELDELKTSRAGFFLKHGTLVASNNRD